MGGGSSNLSSVPNLPYSGFQSSATPLSGIKTWVIRTNGNDVKVGTKVQLQLYGTNLWLSKNTLVSRNDIDTSWSGDSTFFVYAQTSDDDGNRIIYETDADSSIKNGYVIGLCGLDGNFISVNDNGSLTSNVSNNKFVLFAPDLLDYKQETTSLTTIYSDKLVTSTIKNNTAIQLFYYNPTKSIDRYVFCAIGNEVKCAPNVFDDDYMNVNFPYLLLSIRQHQRLKLPSVSLIFCSDYCWDGGRGGDTFYRHSAPPGYAMFGDTFKNAGCNDSNWLDKMTLTYCKIDNPFNPDKPYCKRVTGLSTVGWNSIGGERFRGDKDIQVFKVSSTLPETILGQNVSINTFYPLKVYEGSTTEDPNYKTFGTIIGGINSAEIIRLNLKNTNSQMVALWAVHKDFLEEAVGSASDSTTAGRFQRNLNKDGNKNTRGKDRSEIINSLKNYNNPLWDGGRVMLWDANYNGGDSQNNYVWSVVSIHDRRPVGNDIINIEKSQPGNWIWLQPQKGTWHDIREHFSDSIVLGSKAYLLRPFVTLLRSCYDDGRKGYFQVWEDNSELSEETYCRNLGSEYCNPDKPGSSLESDYCQTMFCSNKKLNVGECNDYHIKFCNKMNRDSSGNPIFYNYDKYPDLCACFMKDPEFSQPACDNLGLSLGIQTTDYIKKKALGIAWDYNNPTFTTEKNKEIQKTQCNQPRVYNRDVCKLSSIQRPNSSKYYDVIAPSDRTNFGDGLKLCFQDMSIDIQGNLGTLNANQTANCGDTDAVVLTRMCISGNYPGALDKCLEEKAKNPNLVCSVNVEFSPCTGAVYTGSNIMFYKTIVNDSVDPTNQYACGYNGDKRFGVVFFKDIVSDICANGLRKITYRVDKSQVNKPFTADVQDALRYMALRYNLIVPDSTLPAGKISLDVTKILSEKDKAYVYNVTENTATITSTCGDCIIDDVNQGSCVLQDKRWKQPYITKGVVQPFNGGQTCPVDSALRYKEECNEDHNCSISFGREGDMCILNKEGGSEFIVEYDINEYNSNNGLNCDGSFILDNVLRTYREGVLSSVERNTTIEDNKVKLSFGCDTCKLEYIPEGQCYKDETNNYKIRKVLKPLTNSQKLSCTPAQLAIIKENKPIIENCSNVCTFKDVGTVECNTQTGVKTIKHAVLTPEKPGGINCDIASASFALGKGYNLQNVTYNKDTKTLNVTGQCEKLQNCEINATPISSVCENNVQKTIYQIDKLPTISGMSCLTAIKNIAGINIKDSDIAIVDNKLTLTGSCVSKKDEVVKDNKAFIYLIVIAIIAILIGIYFVTKK